MKRPVILFLLLMWLSTAHVAFAQNFSNVEEETKVLAENIVQTLGADYIKGRVLMRQTDQVIYDQNSAVFTLGTDSPEKYTVEEWLAVAPDGQILVFDIAQNTWDGYYPTDYREDAPNTPNYTLYTSLLASHEDDWGKLTYKPQNYSELYNVWGLNFIHLVDLDGDGIKELLVVGMDEETASSGTSTSPASKALQVFTLKEGQSIEKIGEFPLIQDFLSPSIKLAKLENKNYLITGDRADTVWYEHFWQLTPTGFNKVKTFGTVALTSPTGSYLGKQVQIDGQDVEASRFHATYNEKWASAMQTTQLTNISIEEVNALIAHNTKARKELAEFSDNIDFAQPQKIFSVKFMGYKSDWLGMPDISPYFSDAELSTLNHQDFGGNEMYIVKNNRQGRTYVYENIIDDQGQERVGRRLYEAQEGEVLFFTCNESEIRPNIVLLHIGPDRKECYFRPSLNLMDGSISFGENAEALPFKK